MSEVTPKISASDQKQRDRAIDPAGSYIVQAPAGSGKTTLLVERYLNLLTVVSQPEEILAITFTRKAANEMRTRVLDELKEPTRKPELVAAVLKRSKENRWNITANPQRLRIQTIDSFNRHIVQQLPFRSLMSLDYAITTDTNELYKEAVARTLNYIGKEKDIIGEDIANALGLIDNHQDNFSDLLVGMLASREQWFPHLRQIFQEFDIRTDSKAMINAMQEVRTLYCNRLKNDLVELVSKTVFSVLVEQTIKRLGYFFEEHPDEENAEAFSSMSHEDLRKMKQPWLWTALYESYYTKAGTLRKKLDKRAGYPPRDKNFKADVENVIELINGLGTEADMRMIAISALPEEDLTPTQERGMLSYVRTLVLAANELFEVFKERKLTDHTEVSIAAQRALEYENAPTQLALALDYRIKHLLVDEYQDTSVAQNRLLNLLMRGWEPEDGNTFFAVGDPMQSIYTFRNADLTNFSLADKGGLENRTPERLTLTNNFRSNGDLVEFCNEVFDKVLGEIDDPNQGLVNFSKADKVNDTVSELADSKLTICESESLDIESRLVAERILELVEKDPDGSKAILVRNRTRLDPIYHQLKERQLTWQGVKITSLADISVVRDLHSLAMAICDPDDKLGWHALLMSPLVGIAIRDIEELATGLERGVDAITTDLKETISDEARLIIDRVREPLLNALRSHQRTLRARIERVWYELGGPYAYESQTALDSDLLKSNALHYLELLEAGDSETPDLDELWRQVAEDYASETNPTAHVQIMTIHAAKGLEFDHVVIPQLGKSTRTETEELLYLRPMSGNKIVVSIKNYVEEDRLNKILFEERKRKLNNETARTLYVGATRAKHTLSLFGSLKSLEKGPAKGTFLSHLINTVSDSQKIYVSDTAEEESDNEGNKEWLRISRDFEFKQPTALPSMPSSLLPVLNKTPAGSEPVSLSVALSGDTAPEANDARIRDFYDLVAVELGYSESLAIGQFVHSELQRVVQHGAIELPTEARINLWRNRLRSQGFTPTQTSSILDAIQEQLQFTYEDETGQWLLDPNHEGSLVEKSFVFPVQGNSTIAIVDRSFIDERIRWVIDYKTSKIPDDEDLDLNLKAQQYQAQLLLYAKIFQELEGKPVRAAIYFTDIASFEEVDISEGVEEVLGIVSGSLAETWGVYRRQRQELRL